MVERKPSSDLRRAVQSLVQEWDGKSTSELGALYSRFADQPEFVSQLLSWGLAPELSACATWLLKRHLEAGHCLSRAQELELLRNAGALADWPSQLHILQMMARMMLPERTRKPAERWVRQCLGHDNKMVRAWAYNGFYELARRNPAMRDEVRQMFDQAQEEEAPSVRARIRQCIKGGF